VSSLRVNRLDCRQVIHLRSRVYSLQHSRLRSR
jgi:hypothetical protein